MKDIFLQKPMPPVPGTDDGRCRCRQQLRNSFLNLKVLQEKLHFFLVFENTTQPSCNVQPQNLMLSERIFLHFFKNSSQPTADLSVRTVRKHGNHRFQIPFDRQQMADYLNLDRSPPTKDFSPDYLKNVISV